MKKFICEIICKITFKKYVLGGVEKRVVSNVESI